MIFLAKILMADDIGKFVVVLKNSLLINVIYYAHVEYVEYVSGTYLYI